MTVKDTAKLQYAKQAYFGFRPAKLQPPNITEVPEVAQTYTILNWKFLA